MKETIGTGCGLVAGSVLALVVLMGGISWLVEQTSLPGDLSQVEQVRADAAVVDPVQAEDVIGQVVEWNQTIVAKQTLNDQWWAGWTIPDEWDRVELIPVPR